MSSSNNEPVRERAIALTQDTTLQKLQIGIILNQYGDKNKVNLRPCYQRHLRWSIENYIAFICTIMIVGYIPAIVLYKLHDDDREELSSSYKHECIDGQHRLNAIIHYIKSEPIIINNKKHMITWYHEKSDTHVFYSKNEDTEKWKNETDKKVSYMTDNEQSHFNECRIPIDLILCKLTYDQRCDMFVSLQQGKLVRNSDLFKNYVRIPLISHIHKTMKMEETYRNTICARLTTNSNQNWIFCAVRMFMIILESNKANEWVKTTDTQIKNKIKEKKPKIMNITQEQIQFAETKINKWISFLDNLNASIKFTPVQMLATFVYFQEINTDDVDNLAVRLTEWAGKGTKEMKRMWYQKEYIEELNGLTRQYQYYTECLEYLRSDSQPIHITVEKRKPFGKQKRNELWDRDFGEDNVGICHTCDKIITKTGKWHAGHIVSHADGGSDDDMDNFIVQCRTCNLQCGTENALVYKEKNYTNV